jgi:subtilase family serine protease
MPSLFSRFQRLASVLRLLGSPAAFSPARGRRSPGRPSIETLEDRMMPAMFQPCFVFDNHGHLGTNVRSLTDLDPSISGYSPAQLRTAYDLNNILFNGVQGFGTGQTIAIVDAYNDPNILADLDMFDQQFSVSNASSQTLFQQFGAAASFLKVLNEKGQVINPTHTNVPVDTSGGWEMEESLDVEWAHALAPGATIELVVANSATFQDLNAAIGAAARQPGVSVVSMSWGASEFSDETTMDSMFTTPAGHQGITYCASAGDDSTGIYPAFSPNVIAVGGTTLNLNADNTIQSETAWSTLSDYSYGLYLGTGGGTSSMRPSPPSSRACSRPASAPAPTLPSTPIRRPAWRSSTRS